MSKYRVDGLTHKQEQAIVTLLNEPTVARAARSLDIHDRTLYRWMRDPTFARAYRDARREAFAQAISVTQRYAPAAVHTLAKIMADDDAPHTARVNAATALLRFSREAIELDDLAGRIDELEEQAAHAEGHGAAAA
jgi:transposase-like protein